MRTAAVVALTLALLGCGESRRYDQAVAILIDVSGTYVDQKEEVVRVIKRELLPNMLPGDTLLVLRIDSQSYEKDNIEVLASFDARPSKANAQKLDVARKLEAFAADKTPSEYTDIPGAMMLAAEYLHEIASASRVMLVFSDLREDLPEGSKRRLSEQEFDGIQVIAMNVKRLTGDGSNPEVFRSRLASWEERVTRSRAAGWRTLLDPAKLSAHLAAVR